MNRSGYVDDFDTWASIKWRGAVKSAIRGKRGQAFFRKLIAALDAMPEKKLVAHDLVTDEGEVCALGAAGIAHGIPVHDVKPDDHDELARRFDVAPALIKETEFVNDDDFGYSVPTDERRWQLVRNWAEDCLIKYAPTP